MDQQEYNRIMGIGSEDIGSRYRLLKKVVQYAKKKGYKTSDFYKMGKRQLKGIFYSKV